MRLKVLHGFFIFEELRAGQVSEFINATKLEIEAFEYGFTFPALAHPPSYSLEGKIYLGVRATKTFEGKPWEIFKENGFVYDFIKGEVVNIASITRTVEITQALGKYVSPGLILPGSLTKGGQKITGYDAFYSRGSGRWLYSGVDFV